MPVYKTSLSEILDEMAKETGLKVPILKSKELARQGKNLRLRQKRKYKKLKRGEKK